MKGKKKKRERLTPEQLDANYNKFMKGKELNPKGLELFNSTLKKAANTKPHDSK